jgi:hypothetical protein
MGISDDAAGNISMPISIDCTKTFLKVKALSSNMFSRDRDLLAKIPGRVPRYGIDSSSGKDSFLYWEMKPECLSDILAIWTPATIIASPEVQKLIDRYELKLKPIEELPREPITVTSADPDKVTKLFQANYISINHGKSSLLCTIPTGGGKSLSSALRAKNIGMKKLLILGPCRLDKKWRTDIREDLAVETLIYRGTKAARERLRADIKDFDVFYTNYEQLKEFSQYCPDFDHIIIDEIHTVCNPDTQVHQVLYDFLRKSQAHIQGLSATPMRKDLESLWGVLRLLDPELAGSKKAFLDEFQEVLATMKVKKRLKSGKVIIYNVPIKVRTKNEDKLRTKLSSIMYLVKKSEIVDFRDNISLIDCEMTHRQKNLYDEAVETLRVELSDKTLDITNPLARMTRLLQISEGLFNMEGYKFKDSGKLEFLKEDIKEKLKDGEKVVVWSRFEPITRELKNLFPDHAVIYSGEVSNSLRDLSVWAFQGIKPGSPDLEEFERLKKYNPEFNFSPGSAQLFLATHSLKSGMGINLQSSHIGYYTSFDWLGTTIHQARDRFSRLGQLYDTETYFLTSELTLERKALKMILTGYEKTLDILHGSTGSLEKKLTREIINLLYE